ncbi:hypothetical protein ACEPPN_012790 [Leptodophora sp. 'Broadleaf-Isolate-01']
MSGTSSKASNVGLNSEKGLGGSDKSTNPGVQSGQEVVNGSDSPPSFEESKGTKREVNIPFRTFGTNFARSFDAGDTPRLGASVHNNHDYGNGQESLMKTSQKTSNGTTREELHQNQDEHASDSSVPQSETSFHSQDSDNYSDISTLSSDEKESVTDHWLDGKEYFTPSDTHIEEEFKSNVGNVAEDLPQDTSLLAAIKEHLDLDADFLSEGLKQAPESSVLTRLKVKRMKELTTFFNSFTRIVQSGSREDLGEWVLNPLFRYVAGTKGTGHDVIPVIDLGDLKTIVEELFSSFIDELEDRCPQNRIAGMIPQAQSESFTPSGTLNDKRKMFHWSLCRKMGFLRIEGFESLHTIRLMGSTWKDDFGIRVLRKFRHRAPCNTKGRWCHIKSCRMAFKEYFDTIKKNPTYFSRPQTLVNDSLDFACLSLPLDYAEELAVCHMAIYLGATACVAQSLQAQSSLISKYKKLFGKGMPDILAGFRQRNNGDDSKMMFKVASTKVLNLLRTGRHHDMPYMWYASHDNLGRPCWIHHQYYCLTYKRPTAKMSLSYMDKHEPALTTTCRSTQTSDDSGMVSSPKPKPKPKPAKRAKVMKFSQKAQPQDKIENIQEPSYEPEPDEVDNSLVLLSDLPRIDTMLCYFSDEEWFLQQGYSDQLPLPLNVATEQHLIQLIDEIKTLRESGLGEGVRKRTYSSIQKWPWA